jgi:outer membrane lipoprotein-sorting protein
MNTHDEQTQAEWLDRLLDDPANNPAGSSPAPELASFAQRVIALKQAEAEAPSSQARARVWARVARQTAEVRPNKRPAARWTWQVWGRLAFAVLAIALVGMWVVRNQPQPVEARTVLMRAQAAMTLSSTNLISFAFTQTITLQPDAATGQAEDVTIHQRWYQAPNLWHSEDESVSYGPDGQALPGQTWHETTISDGTDMWSYDPLRHEVIVNRLNANTEFSSTGFLFGISATSLNAFLQADTTCPDARIKPEPRYIARDVVAGRPTYVIDLGKLECPSAPGLNGRRVIWVDQETFFILKNELHRLSDDRVTSTIEVTRIQYNVPLDRALFTFTPPADAKLLDLRNRATPTPRAGK